MHAVNERLALVEALHATAQEQQRALEKVGPARRRLLMPPASGSHWSTSCTRERKSSSALDAR
jgi:hypothetical protein